MFRKALPKVFNMFTGIASRVVVSPVASTPVTSLCLPRLATINRSALSTFSFSPSTKFGNKGLLVNSLINYRPVPARTIIKFSLKSGKRKTEKAVLRKFYRLDWGVWIHGKCGRNKKLSKKSARRKRRLRQHVFSNGKQSYLLDKMVTKFWRTPKYYVDDPYEPYHKREEFPFTRKTPIPSE